MIKKHEFNKKSLIRLTRIVVILITLYRLFVLVGMFWYHIIHTNRYTYWNYAFQTGFYMLLSIAYIWKNASYLFHILSVFVFPIIFGSVVLVFAYIIIILQIGNGWLFVNASTLGTGNVSIGTVHTADAIVHFITVLDLFVVIASGYQTDARWSILLYTNSRQYGGKNIALRIYYYIAPAVPLLVYTLFFNPFIEYEITSYSPFFLICSAVVIEVFIMTWLYEIMTRTNFTHQLKICDINNSFNAVHQYEGQIVYYTDLPPSPFELTSCDGTDYSKQY